MSEPAKPPNVEEENPPSLKQVLTLFPTTAIVIGSVVGSGIFVSSAAMARSLESGSLLLLVWVVTGIMTLFGALTMSELASQMPRTGGLYEYLKEIYGEKIGFFFGWANFVIAGSGAIAGIGYVFSNYFGEFVPLFHLSPELEKFPIYLPYLGTIFPLADMGVKMLGSLLIIFLTWINIRGVEVGATFQSISTTAKLAAIFGLVLVTFLFGSEVGSFSNLTAATAKGNALTGWTLLTAIGMAMAGAFWSYDGWGNLPYIAGEIKNPSKTIPRAIVLGSLCFIVLYVLVNMAYLYVLPVNALGSVAGDRIASRAFSMVTGPLGGSLVTGLILLCTTDTLNAAILTNARVYFAMAHKNMFWKSAGKVHPVFRTPHRALFYQGLWALVLLITGSFDMIMSMYVFINWVLYAMMAVGVFVLRRRHPNAVRPFKIPGYPWVPGIFSVFSISYVLVTLVSDIYAYQAGEQPVIKSLMGLALVSLGSPFYLFWKSRSTPPANRLH
jgi:basic amino acid/polyamine antiporter, APA family